MTDENDKTLAAAESVGAFLSVAHRVLRDGWQFDGATLTVHDGMPCICITTHKQSTYKATRLTVNKHGQLDMYDVGSRYDVARRCE